MMTEREKRIEKMKKCVCDVYDNTVRHTVNIVDLVCGILEQEGYRKADEVRKETMKEIYKIAKHHYEHGDLRTFMLNIKVVFLSKFGVEVEE